MSGLLTYTALPALRSQHTSWSLTYFYPHLLYDGIQCTYLYFTNEEQKHKESKRQVISSDFGLLKFRYQISCCPRERQMGISHSAKPAEMRL